ncbi:hypothetical protein J1N35_030882 [Gossypium stocksii]|uniref:Uncharacterized protein n=1 Tax=Gossypium stocksii TaxID=47602 RepID=A0A9D3V000_9ROSI|nr:hypothetical protein J1N35_030882 [Gossypium stocksii]
MRRQAKHRAFSLVQTPIRMAKHTTHEDSGIEWVNGEGESHSFPFWCNGVDLGTRLGLLNRGTTAQEKDGNPRHMLLAEPQYNGKEALKDVPENIVVMPLTDTSAFVGAMLPPPTPAPDMFSSSESLSDPAVVTSETLKAVFVNYGDHPFDLVKDSMMILEKQFGTFALRETKQANARNARLVRLVHMECILLYVYVWHALLGYWGGLVPNAVATKNYDPKLRYPILSPFYDDLHGYLASQDVDGVKVDAQNILETISACLGGGVSLTRRFQQALEGSIAANFSDNSIICCMAQSTDSIYHLHDAAEFHAVARAQWEAVEFMSEACTS